MKTVDIDVFDDRFLADPYAFHDELRDVGPVFYLSRYDVFGMARYAQVSATLKDHRTYCSGRGVGLSDFAVDEPWRPPSLLLEVDPPLHDRTRSLMNKVVSPLVLKSLRSMWAERASALIERLVRQGRVDLTTELAEAFPLMIFPDTIGLRADGREHLLPYAAAAFNAFGPRNQLRETHAVADAVEWVASACRRENLTRDGWGMSVYRAADAGLCTQEEAERLVRSFLSAGVDTTVNGLGNMLHAFTLYPDQWQLLRANPSLLKKAFEEGLRWDSTVQSFCRTTTNEVEIDGCVVPAGRKILLFFAAANRDPRRWTNADDFDITRNASGHVAFGFGIHQCLGQMVARMEAEVVLEVMLPRIAAIVPAGKPKRRLNNTLRALASCPADLMPA